MRRFRKLVLTSVLLAASAATPALAQQTEPAAPATASLGFGVKAGFGIDPGQFVIGAQYSLGKSLGIVRVVPNAHLGFGDVTTFDINVDFLVRLVAKDNGFGFYGGAAPTFVTGDGFSEFGGTLVVGAQVPLIKNRATNIEGRFGLGDVPEIRILLSLIL